MFFLAYRDSCSHFTVRHDTHSVEACCMFRRSLNDLSHESARYCSSQEVWVRLLNLTTATLSIFGNHTVQVRSYLLCTLSEFHFISRAGTSDTGPTAKDSVTEWLGQMIVSNPLASAGDRFYTRPVKCVSHNVRSVVS